MFKNAPFFRRDNEQSLFIWTKKQFVRKVRTALLLLAHPKEKKSAILADDSRIVEPWFYANYRLQMFSFDLWLKVRFFLFDLMHQVLNFRLSVKLVDIESTSWKLKWFRSPTNVCYYAYRIAVKVFDVLFR